MIGTKKPIRTAFATSGSVLWDTEQWKFVKTQRSWLERFGAGEVDVEDFYRKGRMVREQFERLGIREVIAQYASQKFNFLDPKFKTTAFFRICHQILI